MLASQETRRTFDKCQWAALSRPDVTWSTYYNARLLLDLDIAGDFVECGVFAGVHIAMMYRAIADSGKPARKIHLLDTFDGVPAGTAEDGECGVIGKARCSLAEVKTYMASWRVGADLLEYHQGMLEETLPNLPKFPIAFLRIDCDLYAGVSAVLKHLYPSLVERGICVLDDYAFQGARQAFMEQFGPDVITPGPGTISPITWQRRGSVSV